MDGVTELFPGVFRVKNKLATLNLVPGRKVYGEELVRDGKTEYRLWNPYRSKLGAAILNGLKTFEIKRASNVLYIGAATGTTASHVSDVASEGKVYCVELSERNMRNLFSVCESRPNMLPILGDSMYPDKYENVVGECDVIYQDASAKDQAALITANSRFLKKGGHVYFVIKSQSIDISKQPEEVFEEELAKLSGSFKVLERVKLEPYDELHLFAVLVKK
jgi:fibrillarin-like pre-rRNA processing protein